MLTMSRFLMCVWRKGAALKRFNFLAGYISYLIISYHPLQMLLKIRMTLEMVQKGKKNRKVAFIFYLSHAALVHAFTFLNLDHCVVINMHWKVLCFCRSHGSPICFVLM